MLAGWTGPAGEGWGWHAPILPSRNYQETIQDYYLGPGWAWRFGWAGLAALEKSFLSIGYAQQN